MDKKLQKNLIVTVVLVVNIILLIAVVRFLLSPDETVETNIQLPTIAKTHNQQQSWKKIKTIIIASKTANALAVKTDGTLLVGDDDGITLYDKNGKKLKSIVIKGGIVALTSDKDTIYAALPRQIIKIDGRKLTKWAELSSRTLITAIAIQPEPQASRLLEKTHKRDAYATMTPAFLFIADAGNRKVYGYTAEGKKLWESSGTENEKFIVPSPYFDLVPDGDGGIWVVNPGRHRVENYTATGKFKALWEPVPRKTMLGCCNPAYLGVLSGDRFVTIEKGLVRSRLFAPSGKVIDTIVSENDFSQREFKYNLAILPGNRVAILDSVGRKIDIYAQHKEN